MRRILAWVLRLISPISSRNNVPLCASSNLPARELSAPVKAPFSWPNSSLSINSSGMAAQFTATSGASALLLLRCTARAASSLPVPFSPVIRTQASVGATCASSCRNSVMAGDCPMISSSLCSMAARKALFSRRNSPISSVCWTSRRTFSSERGFSIKSCAPRRNASTAVSILPWPEIMTTGRSGKRSLNMSSASRPSMPGSQMSRKIISGGEASAFCSPSSADDASSTA